MKSMAEQSTRSTVIPSQGPHSELWQSFPALHLVRTTWWIRVFGRVTIGLLLASLVAVIFVPWQQTARGTGRVVALDPQERPQTMNSPYEGVVNYVQPGLREGSYVRRGDRVMELSPFAANAIAQLDSQIQQIEIKRDSTSNNINLAELIVTDQRESGRNLVEALERQVEAAQQKLEQQKREVEVLQAELEQKQYDYDQAQMLYPKGLISELELVRKRNALAQARSQLNRGESMVEEYLATYNSKQSELESKKQDIEMKIRQAESKLQDENQKLATTEKELIDLQVKRQEFERLDIKAPRSGYLNQVIGLEGSNTVKKGDPLFTVVPDTTALAVELKIPGRDMPLIQASDKVRLQFEGWPAVQFVGWPSVAVGTFGGEIRALSPTDDNRGNFSVLVVPDQQNPSEPEWPDDRYLRQGVRANGWVLLNQVPLGYEIWRLLNGFPPIVAPDEPGKGGKPKLPK
jgi:multidrug resistance efflux pump